MFEGMKDNEVGLYSKMHHAAIDGGAGAALTNMIYDISPIPRKVDPPAAGSKPGQEPRDIAANLLDSYQQLFNQPLDAERFAAEERERIFRPFWSGDGGSGTGLGLAIAHELAAALGGRIELDSEPGAGSRFRLLLPTGDQ